MEIIIVGSLHKVHSEYEKINLTFKFSHSSFHLQVMKTYHMYHSESISAESKLKEAEKQEEKQIGRGDQVFSIRMEDKYQRRSSVKKIEKMKEKVCSASAFGKFNHLNCNTDITIPFARAFVSFFSPSSCKELSYTYCQNWRTIVNYVIGGNSL